MRAPTASARTNPSSLALLGTGTDNSSSRISRIQTDFTDPLRARSQLLPNEPNAWDSYAEFLMKEGKFDESVRYSQRVGK